MWKIFLKANAGTFQECFLHKKALRIKYIRFTDAGTGIAAQKEALHLLPAGIQFEERGDVVGGPMLSIKHLNPRTEHLKRRATVSGLLFIIGLMYAFLSLLFEISTRGSALWGIYAMAAGFAGYGIYKIRYYARVFAHRRKAAGASLTPIIYSGGIR